MTDERISVSAVSLESAEAYIQAAVRALGTTMSIQTNSAKADLARALACLNEAKMSDEEVREAH